MMRRRSGITLAETALALLLFLVTFAACAQLYGLVVDQVSLSRSRLLADRLAGAVLEAYESGAANDAGLPVFTARIDDLLKVPGARKLLTGGAPAIEELLTTDRFAISLALETDHGRVRGLTLATVRVTWVEDGHAKEASHGRLFAF